MSESNSILKKIIATEIDGRARTPHFIFEQLAALHKTLLSCAPALRDAIRHDAGFSEDETELELFLALAAVKQHASQADPQTSLHEEYSLARDEDAPERRAAYGIVYIVPCQRNLCYSTIVPLSAAIAAGNCVLVELNSSSSMVAGLLHQHLTAALDSDSFAFVDDRPSSELAQLRQHKLVFVDGTAQAPTPPAGPSKRLTTSPPQGLAVSIVDRSAHDIRYAAKALARARTSFNGKASYAPDLILVNEFCAQEFVNAVVTEMTAHLAGTAVYVSGDADSGIGASANSLKSHKTRDVSNGKGLSVDERNEPGTRIVMSGDEGSVVVVQQRPSKLLGRKWNQPVLIVHPVSSLDDAIDYANTHTSSSPLLATYLFASSAHAKYLAQFIDSSLALVNDIPLDILVGPAAPADFPAALSPRYAPEMFSTPCPAFSKPQAALSAYSQTLSDWSRSFKEQSDGTLAARLREAGQKPLVEKKRREGKSVGFFDQGILTGLVTIILPSLAAFGTVSYFGARQLLRLRKG